MNGRLNNLNDPVLNVLKEKDEGSGGNKMLHDVLFFTFFALYIQDESCRIIQVNKNLRTLNNVTGLFDGGYVRNGWHDATDTVVKAGPARDRIGCADFPVAGCCLRRSKTTDYLDGGDLFVVLSFCRRTLLCGGSFYKNVIEITTTYRIYLKYFFFWSQAPLFFISQLREILTLKTK